MTAAIGLQVQHIRAKYGDYFGITVAGYPVLKRVFSILEAHPDMIQGDGGATLDAYDSDLAYLKRKVICYIIFVYMIIVHYDLTNNILQIPSEITAALEPIKDNEEAVRAYGVHLGTETCRKILAHGIKTLHLYTLNMEKSALAILMNLGLIEESKVSRSLPWRRPANVFRVKEDVRPIFWYHLLFIFRHLRITWLLPVLWMMLEGYGLDLFLFADLNRANRPKSYISRTVGWDQYPHGRWGDSNNPSYGALTDYQIFMKFCLGKLRSSPWSELDGLQPETKIIDEQLSLVNLKGFLTINSQPAVNGEKSDSSAVGKLSNTLFKCLMSDSCCFLILFVIVSHSQAQRSYYLVSLVDNDYVHGDIFAAFKDI
ncbi:hypothetical protein GW17_00047812 [Ensete ventricosum]|nr:hypothetical protein GW17_00047812 [Ensete ventricosum]